ncbi:erythroblast NAD(P)(+)--arginine ADP-ribosyltransferase-like [Colossoma macropomum]|uniref:erythroblast NAD(P)(+)--arginine ADP-ribosyltransferase-like n=1 Tax=Colossoma macropomum TaxID=42526 RepID=UPI00186416FD|nr:erythroblast NAD(P)(+)--arginine ADP-ribosyltransferase-like [Colossoma macropomum]
MKLENTSLFSAHPSCVHFGTAKTSGITARMECWSVNPFLLILLTGLIHTVTAEKRMLDMAPDAVDDTFSECRDKMMQKVTAQGGLLQKELKANKDFADMWRGHGGTCEKQIYRGRAHHLAALQAYGNSGVHFRKTFNRLIQTKGSNATTYNDEFPFKSLHFLLTDALQLLNYSKTCSTVYFGTNNQYTAEIGKEVRFGRFIGASIRESLEIEQIITADEGTLFNIMSCSVVNVENFTCTSEEIERLISPTEVFRVQSIETASTDDVDYKIITLTHSGFLSNHDCYLFQRPPHGSSSPLLSSMVLALMASFLSLYYRTVTQ